MTIVEEIRQVIQQELLKVFRQLQIGLSSTFLDAADAAEYLSISRRGFESISKHIPCHRINGTGKRIYSRADLDAFMAKHRIEPKIKARDLSKLVDEVVGKIRGTGR